jgi:hypothetical protein
VALLIGSANAGVAFVRAITSAEQPTMSPHLIFASWWWFASRQESCHLALVAATQITSVAIGRKLLLCPKRKPASVKIAAE